MAHLTTEPVQVNSDMPGGAFLNFHEVSFPGVGVWHMAERHPQFVYLNKGIVSYLVFDNRDVALDWMARNVNADDRVYEVRGRELADVTQQVLNATKTPDAVSTTSP